MSLGMSFARRRMMAVPGGIAVDPILNNNPWDVISAVSTAGEAANWWSVGDRKAVVLNGTVGSLSLSNYTVYAFIIGFDHNASLEGAGRIHFQIGKTALSGGKDVALCDSKYGQTGSDVGFRMNTSNTSSGGWNNSYMRETICQAFKNILPTDLKNVIKNVTKYSNNTGKSTAESAITATTDEIFLLSEYEVYGKVAYGNTNESKKQAQYSYYLAGNDKRKYNHSNLSSIVSWWLRSSFASASTSFLRGDGSAVNLSYANNSYGFAPAFCV